MFYYCYKFFCHTLTINYRVSLKQIIIMASIKVKFRTSSVEGREGTIYYQIIHRTVVRQINTNYKVFEKEWDRCTCTVIPPAEGDRRFNYICAVRSAVEQGHSRLQQVVKLLDRGDSSYVTDDVVSLFNGDQQGVLFFDFMRGVIVRLIELKRYRTSETYKTTLNSFMRFRDEVDLFLGNMTSDLMMNYETYLKDQNISMNTISFYMRILRAVYNRAVDDELIEQRHPFKKVYTGVDKTAKRALPIKYIKSLKELDLLLKPKLMLARDLFLFSFYTRGMSFVDMAYLRKKDLQNGVITYRRRKTGQQLQIKWESCMQDIVNRYPIPETEYLLPIISDQSADPRYQYIKMLSTINARLKKLGVMIGLTTPLTLYVARHSWASVAKSQNIPISIISQGMGHDSEVTTQIYLASLATSVVDRANRSILRLI